MTRSTIVALTMFAVSALAADAAAGPRQIEVLHGRKTGCTVSVEFEQAGHWQSHVNTQPGCVAQYEIADEGNLRIAFEVTPNYGRQIDVPALTFQFEIPAEERRLLRPFSIQVPPQLTGDHVDLTIERYWQNLSGPARASLGEGAGEIWEQVLWAHMAMDGQREDRGPIVIDGNSTLDCSRGGTSRRGRYACLAAIIERGCYILSSTPPTRLVVARARRSGDLAICGPLGYDEATELILAEHLSKRPILIPPAGSNKP